MCVCMRVWLSLVVVRLNENPQEWLNTLTFLGHIGKQILWKIPWILQVIGVVRKETRKEICVFR